MQKARMKIKKEREREGVRVIKRARDRYCERESLKSNTKTNTKILCIV